MRVAARPAHPDDVGDEEQRLTDISGPRSIPGMNTDRGRARRRRALAVSIVVLVTTLAPAALADRARAKRWPVNRWLASLSEPRYEGVVSSKHYIAAKDGTELALTVHLPEGLERGRKIPTLLQLSPYRPLDQAGGGTPEFDFFVVRGAAYVQADERGTGGSSGCLDFGGTADRIDAQVFATWIRSQPWSNGRIVTDGVSHPGMGSVVAHAAIPKLTGALAHAPVVSYYQDEWLQGAKFEAQLNGPAYQAIELAPPLPPEFADPNAAKNQAAPCTGRTAADYSGYDGPFTDIWADRDLSRHVPRERKPILLTHGFVDLNVHPDHSQLYWDALPDSYPKYAVFGWWYHQWPDLTDHPAERFVDMRHRWMDALLFGKENGLWLEPRVLVEDSTGTWRESHDWPLDGSKRQTFYAGAGEQLAAKPGKAAAASYRDDPRVETGEWGGAKAVFRTAPLTQDRLITGAPKLRLTGSSTEAETKWVVYLVDEDPDGNWERVTNGYVDSHTWAGESKWADMTPGRPYRWTVNLLPTAYVVEAGHRLTLVVASKGGTYLGGRCWDDHTGGSRCYRPTGILPARTAGRATNTVHLGRDGTRLELDWIDPRRTRKPPQ
ncbi:MAG TPA: CocE/NonD family hydrolase [Mycobacteriales bacterium]|nr:CocE/NonD family hydrolase [Mycobacteriales bacterium]